jgi:phosphate transporter
VPEVVVIGSAWAISAAMALPFSSFPNVNSLLIVDDFQKSYLQVQDFVRCGLPMTIFSIALIATLGFVVIAII